MYILNQTKKKIFKNKENLFVEQFVNCKHDISGFYYLFLSISNYVTIKVILNRK